MSLIPVSWVFIASLNPHMEFALHRGVQDEVEKAPEEGFLHKAHSGTICHN